MLVTLSFLVALITFNPVSYAAAYEAESASLSGGAVVANDHAGYSGSGFVGGFTDGNKGSAAVQFQVQAAAAGIHEVSLRYANGTYSGKTLSIYVNDVKVKQATLSATANWDTWTNAAELLLLNSGVNTIRYQFDHTDSGNVNLDKIDVVAASAPSGNLLEAELAILSGGAMVAADHPGYSGSGFVGGFTDGNKGNAAVQFSYEASEAGNYSMKIGYANGTGNDKTVSLYINGAKQQQIVLSATANWDIWGIKNEQISLNSGINTIQIKFDTTDSGNINLDYIELEANETTPTPTPTPIPTPGPATEQVYEAEEQFYSGGVVKQNDYVGHFSSKGARVVFTVQIDSGGDTSAKLKYANDTGSNRTLNMYVNGVFAKTTTLAPTGGSQAWGTKEETITVRKGVNTISYQFDDGNNGGNINIDSLSIAGGIALAERGATVSYYELEAEGGITNAQILNGNRQYLTVESESSGRSAVKLTNTGHYVQWTAPADVNALVIRYSMPDAANGGGLTETLSLYVNEVKKETLTLSSKYAWTYGEYPYHDHPSGGEGHRFYDESRFLVSDIPAGATVKLQKDGADQAAYYTIDLINLEQVDAAYAMPANFVSITDFGAVADDNGDDTDAIRNAIQHVKATGKAGVWIPAGTFKMNDRINVSDIQIRGAGMWYSTLQGTNGKGGFYGTGNGVTIADLALFGDSVYRNDGADHAAFEGNFGQGSLIQGVWVEHMKVGMWLQSGTDGLYIVDGRIRNTWADGVNFHGGVKNTTISHFSVRNTGDDAFAMWSSGIANENNSFRYNTAQMPVLANTFAIYGGKDNKILDNLASDTVTASAGIVVSTRFDAVPFSGTTEVKRNTLQRTGGWERNWNTSFGALWIYAENQSITAPIVVEDIQIYDSTYEAIKLSYGQQIANISFNNVTIQGAGTYGIVFDQVTGTGYFNGVAITGASLGAVSNPNNQFNVVKGSGNSGW